jgi:ferredoxin
MGAPAAGRLLVDQDRCLGYGHCEERTPRVFRVGDDGISQVLGHPDLADPDLMSEIEAARRDCPTQAIRWDPVQHDSPQS